MVQLRWVVSINKPEPKLQYRFYYDTNLHLARAGHRLAMGNMSFEPNMQWSDWVDVRVVDLGISTEDNINE